MALTAGVSARHLSFIETGRARASAELLVALGDVLEMPLRERNALLLSGGQQKLATKHVLRQITIAVVVFLKMASKLVTEQF